MLKHALTFVALTTAFISTGCVNSKMHEPQPQLKLTNKLVTFNVFTDKDFSDARWNDSKVQIKLAISRIRQNPYEQHTEFDTTFAWIEFKDLPEATSKIQVEKKITGFNDSQEDVAISYAYTTSIDGYEMSNSKSDFINKWEAKKEINIQF